MEGEGEESSMPISLVYKSKTSIKIITEDFPLELVNAIRRSSMLYVPAMAIDDVYIIENNSPLYDEIVAHRLGLIPFSSEEVIGHYRPPEECSDCKENCDGCYNRIYLEAEATDKEKVVYSGEIKSGDPEVKPVNEKIPIVLLGRGQKISIEGKMRLGYGKEHSKFSPVTTATVTYYPSVELSDSSCKELLTVCPTKVFAEKEGKVVVEREDECILCEECMRVCKGVKVSNVQNKFFLTLESTGSMKPERILIEAANSLIRKLNEFEKGLEEIA